jgi:hypothetical protein
VEKERLDAKKKKPKMNGFSATTTISDAIAPRPSQYAIQKLDNFEYIELWYFSPKGCKDTMKSSLSIADDTFSLARLDDQLIIHPASAFKASKAALPDHELLFSTFLHTKNLFLTHASTANWLQMHLNALALFFWHLENHTIRNNSELGNIVILHYALHVRLNWHDRLKRDDGFNIGIINETLMRSINEEMWDRVHSRTLALVHFIHSKYAENDLTVPLFLCSFIQVIPLQSHMHPHSNHVIPTHQCADAHTMLMWMPAPCIHMDAHTPSHMDAHNSSHVVAHTPHVDACLFDPCGHSHNNLPGPHNRHP